ncbi:MAG: CO or xanthine dehydrogenase, Mo-binding subunit [Chloroflexi bacterium]|nr:MAG: CO or xanthine dehydrogenase, Mo-binding subunit [Chloroflexota bacterium]
MKSTEIKKNRDFKYIGQRPLRPDGVEKVTGKALYGADLNLPDTIYGKILRSPHAHAKIVSIDTNEAKNLPGVKAVLTAEDLIKKHDRLYKDLEGTVSSSKYLSNNVLAEDKVLYVGHAVAAVAAISPYIALEALSLIKVEYDVLRSVSDVKSSMDDHAPILLETPITASLRDSRFESTNIVGHCEFSSGDVQVGFSEADVVVETEYITKTVHQGYIEPQSATALWSKDDRQLKIWCSNQGHFSVRHEVSAILEIPVSQIKVIPMEIGGGFGGKITAHIEPVAAMLSRKSGRPVKISLDRSEVFQCTSPTSGGIVKAKIGATKDGKFTAARCDIYLEAGAFPGSFIENGCNTAFAPYNISNLQVTGYDIVTNKPKTGAYRAPGTPNSALAVETAVDEISRRLRIDPVGLRLKNAADKGTRKADGTIYPDIGMIQTAQSVIKHPHYSAPLPKTTSKFLKVGRGIAFGYSGNINGAATVMANVVEDGTVTLIMGSVDVGGTRISIAQQFAEVLGISPELINPTVADTDSIGYTSASVGSSASHKSGWAAYQCALDIKDQLEVRVSKIWDVDKTTVVFENGHAKSTTDPKLIMSFKDLSSMLDDTGGPITGRGNITSTGCAGSFSANIVDLEVDMETGKVNILKYTAFQDVGKAIHPGYVEGQIQGGTVQGIGWALHEEYVFDEHGKMTNSSLLDYRMPTSWDVPMIDAQIVESHNPGHPYGARGVGEASIVPPLPAISNAINDAIGCRIPQLPMSPTNIYTFITNHDHLGAIDVLNINR